jgi:hypothetical protein
MQKQNAQNGCMRMAINDQPISRIVREFNPAPFKAAYVSFDTNDLNTKHPE